jgi:hypothetical protein
MSDEQRKTVRMNGLRIYITVRGSDKLSGDIVFYSRRAEGPYYRWSYEEKLEQWRGSRMRTSDLTPRELCVASWKGVPAALQASLIEHYLE